MNSQGVFVHLLIFDLIIFNIETLDHFFLDCCFYFQQGCSTESSPETPVQDSGLVRQSKISGSNRLPAYQKQKILYTRSGPEPKKRFQCGSRLQSNKSSPRFRSGPPVQKTVQSSVRSGPQIRSKSPDRPAGPS